MITTLGHTKPVARRAFPYVHPNAAHLAPRANQPGTAAPQRTSPGHAT